MLNKKIIIIFIFFVSLLTTSTVFANENTIIDENSELLSDYQLNYDVTIIESSNEHAMNSNIKGFNELNKLINDNNETYIELHEDYTYNPSYDFNFKNGISINRQINIIGNGFTINGGNTARIFNITVNNVFISGVNFINAYSSDNGGAIIGSTNFGVINCNFTNNVANDDGGAIYGGTATNCNFENNIAKRGGSISKGYAISSYFIRNSANYGGALYETYAENSSFILNSANYSSGVMLGGQAINCNFSSNSANSFGCGEFYAIGCKFFNNSAKSRVGVLHGNAINCIFNSNYAIGEAGVAYDSYLINCTLSNNHAEIGGVMVSGNVVNSTFKNNYATNFGGALVNAYSLNCTFIKNSAKNGGAIYQGSAKNCTFNENYASENGGASYESSSCDSSIFINNIANNGGAMWHCAAVVNSLFQGNIAVVQGGALYASSSRLSKFKSNFANEGGAMFGGSAILCDFVSNNAKYGGAIAGGCQAISSNLTNNVASITGGAYYESQISDCKLEGNLPKYKLFVSNFEAIYGFGGEIKVRLSDSQDYSITGIMTIIRIYDSNNNLIMSNPCQSGFSCFVDLDVGKYTVVVQVDDNNYNVDPVTTTINIKKASFIYVVGVTATYNINNPLIVNLHDSNGIILKNTPVSININGVTKTYYTNKNGQVLLSNKGLTPKTYVASITFSGNDKYFKTTAKAMVTVKKAKPIMIANKQIFKLKVKTKKYTMTLKNNIYQFMKNTKVTLKVNGKTYYARTNSKGIATFKITKLSKKGTFNAVIKYSGNGCYNALSKTVKITVKK